MNDTLFLSNSDSKPMYQQIVEQIIAKVLAGDWPAGYAIPSIRELASASQVSVITVKRAYLELERAGVIVTRQGKGSFVAETQDLTRQRARAELDLHLHAMLQAAVKLGLELDGVLYLVSNQMRSFSHAPNSQPTKGNQP